MMDAIALRLQAKLVISGKLPYHLHYFIADTSRIKHSVTCMFNHWEHVLDNS